MSVIKYLVIGLLIYFLIRGLYKFFIKMPMNFNTYINNMGRDADQKDRKKKEGEITIEHQKKEKGKNRKDYGDYIDFEDVEED